MSLFKFMKKEEPVEEVVHSITTPKNVIVFDYLNKLEDKINHYMAIYLHTNKLQNQNLNSLPRQALIETFSTVVKKSGGELFSLPNDATLVIFNNKSLDEVKSALVKITFLFYNDPIVENITDIETSSFVDLFDFPKDVDQLRELVLKSMNNTGAQKQEENLYGGQQFNISSYKDAKKLRRNLSPDILSKLQQSLKRTDFSSLIRRQSVCAIIGRSHPHILFDEIFVSIPDLRDTFLPDVDLTANPWLFQALTETLDNGVLSNIMRRDDSFLTSNFSLNLNVETILSDAFLRFDNITSPHMRATIVLELQMVDILSDLRAYNLAKTFAQARGYKICIDGITTDKLQYINKSELEADFIKIFWSDNVREALEADGHFSDYSNKKERSKMILCRVDDENAVKIGNDLGINLYQGRYIQKLLASKPKPIKFDLGK